MIFGGSGFLGKEIANQLNDTNNQVYTASRSLINDYSVDITDFNDFKKLPENFFRYCC